MVIIIKFIISEVFIIIDSITIMTVFIIFVVFNLMKFIIIIITFIIIAIAIAIAIIIMFIIINVLFHYPMIPITFNKQNYLTKEPMKKDFIN